jgi:hypothetical protein
LLGGEQLGGSGEGGILEVFVGNEPDFSGASSRFASFYATTVTIISSTTGGISSDNGCRGLE